MKQVPLSQWPSFLTEEVAVLRQEVCDLEQSLGILFEEDFDDLDFFKAALLIVEGRFFFALKKYKHCPGPGVGVLVVGKKPDELLAALNDALSALHLGVDSITWFREDVQKKMRGE